MTNLNETDLRETERCLTWYEMSCPYCNTHCLVYSGDHNDLTMPDIESVRCHKCKKIFLTPGTFNKHETVSGETIKTVEDLEMDPWESTKPPRIPEEP